MPWLETQAVEQRCRFVMDVKAGMYTLSELSQRYGISRPTAYKWWNRYKQEGVEGLADRSRAPRCCPHKTPPELEGAIVQLRKRHPSWGPRKILQYLHKTRPHFLWPACSTAGEILKRRGLIKPRRRRRRWAHPGRPVVELKDCNDVWTADFKGEFKTRNGQWCYPLTVVDPHSRYLLACSAKTSTRYAGVQPVFERLFRRWGVPQQILTDNGAPFSSTAMCGLSRLAVWWIKLGIQPLRIQPGQPQQNGRHERLHRTLKAETTRPAAASLPRQQQRFDRFQRYYNQTRPHQALGGKTPSDLYRPSPRAYSSQPHIEYPPHFLVRKVNQIGVIKLQSRSLFLSTTLNGEYVGLDETDDGIFSIYLGHVLLARFDRRKWKLYP